MIAFSKFVELHEEMSSCLSEIEQHIKSVLGYSAESKEGVLVDFGVYNLKEFTLYYINKDKGQAMKSKVGEKDYPTMMQITSKDELLSFLEARMSY